MAFSTESQYDLYFDSNIGHQSAVLHAKKIHFKYKVINVLIGKKIHYNLSIELIQATYI